MRQRLGRSSAMGPRALWRSRYGANICRVHCNKPTGRGESEHTGRQRPNVARYKRTKENAKKSETNTSRWRHRAFSHRRKAVRRTSVRAFKTTPTILKAATYETLAIRMKEIEPSIGSACAKLTSAIAKIARTKRISNFSFEFVSRVSDCLSSLLVVKIEIIQGLIFVVTCDFRVPINSLDASPDQCFSRAGRLRVRSRTRC